MGFIPGLLGILPLVAAFLCAAPVAYADDAPQEASGYRLGKGLHLGDSGLWLGGYANLQVEDLKSTSWQAQLNDLSLFVGWERGRWRFFSEFEIGDALEAGNGQALTTHQGYFNLERLYLDCGVASAFNVRFGKFLTPIGRWNQIHAAPLVWTTSTPLIVNGPFAMHTSGGMAYGNFEAFERLWGYSVYGGGRNQFDFKSADASSDDNYQDPLGFRLFQDAPGLYQIGVSYAHYSERNFHAGVKNLLGLDAFWTRKRYELSGEFIYRFGTGLNNREFDARDGSGSLWGLYVQGVAPVLGDLYAIARYEAFQREGAGSAGSLWLAGLAYRPRPAVVFKAEYRFADYADKNPHTPIFGGFTEGFAASVAVLF